MISDYKPIIVRTPSEFDEIEIYLAHDIHYGNECADVKRWERVKNEILDAPNRYVILVGDYLETAIVGGKSDVYSQQATIAEQQLWLQQELHDFGKKLIALVPGNHEARIYKNAGLHIVHQAAQIAGVADRYRDKFAFVDIAVGSGGHGKGKQVHYFGFITHRLKDCKGYNGSDFIEGIDFACFGHDHAPKDQARSKLVYDSKSKTVSQRDIEVLDSGSFLTYGGYAVDGGYRPASSKLYKIVLNGNRKCIKTIGYHI